MEGVSNIWIEKGIEKGKESGMKAMKNMLIDALTIKYKNISQSVGNFIQSIKDEDTLQQLHREAILSNSFSEFQHKLATIRAS